MHVSVISKELSAGGLLRLCGASPELSADIIQASI